ncbi:porin [Variovorax sp. J31P207]|uniref:porin n=1 Tax=Variovorax sp. J31P207 TaxID=3053510 RepID=UPI002574FA05|nr:porin [Variovorax sp. J31P207]MDM0069583.1 porin [Variovorax sp. J31P207]
MKKSLVALAALAVAGIASAQSSVTLFGVVDATISGFSNKSEDRNAPTLESLANQTFVNRGTATTSQTVLRNSGYNSSRLGFRGTEDLGGGLAASFWLEGALNNDDGTGTAVGGGQNWQRRSTVSLSGNFGEIRLGRDYTPTFWNDNVFDPFGLNGVGANLISTANGYNNPGSVISQGGFTANTTYSRASNSIGYFLPPNLGGFYGQFMYAMNEKTSYDPGGLTPPGSAAVVNDPALLRVSGNERAGRYIGGRVGYANGPLDVALAYGESTVGSNFYAGTTDSLDTWNLGASYDFGVVKLFGEYSNAKLKRDASTVFVPTAADPFGFRQPSADGWLLGATVPVGPGLIRMSYSAVNYKNTGTYIDQVLGFRPDPKADKFALGYVHNLSKRTALYATVARVNNKEGSDLTLGGPAFVTTAAGATMTPKTSTGYDLGIRHSF